MSNSPRFPKASHGKLSAKRPTAANSARKTSRRTVPDKIAIPARKGTKQSTLISHLRRREGATITELQTATGWQAHSVRGAFSGALKKKLGLSISSKRIEGRGRVYRIAQGT